MKQITFSVSVDMETADNLEILTHLAGGVGIHADVVKAALETGAEQLIEDEGYRNGLSELGTHRRQEVLGIDELQSRERKSPLRDAARRLFNNGRRLQANRRP